MAAISVPAPVDLEVAVRPRPVVVGLPGNVLFPPAKARPRSRVRPRAANLLSAVLVNGVVAILFAVAACTASKFVGAVELESANRDSLRSADRASAATLFEGGLRKIVDSLQSDEAVEQWARRNGFEPPYRLASSPLGASK